MPGNLQPLDQQFPVVDPATGKPTRYFIQWAQQRQIDITAGITAAEAQQIVIDYLAAHPLTAGIGITLSPSGDIGEDVTIAVNLALGELNDVDLVTTPPADGDVLKYVAADNNWVPGVGGGGGGGGGNLIKLGEYDLSGLSSFTISGLTQDYDDLVGSLQSLTTVNNYNGVALSINAVTTGYYSRRTGTVNTGALLVDAQNNQPSWSALLESAPGGQTNYVGSSEFILSDYTSALSKAIHTTSTSCRNETDFVRHNGEGMVITNQPITSLTLALGSGTWTAGSKLVLYGRGGPTGGIGGDPQPRLTETPFAPWTVPTYGSFSQVNISTATFADSLAGIVAIIPGGAAFAVRGLLQAAPAAPWNIYCHVDPQNMGRGNNNRVGIACRNTGSGRVSQFGWLTGGDGALRASILHWNNVNSYSGDSSSDVHGGGAQWFRLENDGTNLNLYFGDGYNWILVRTETLASWLGSVDEIGFMWQIDQPSIVVINSFSLVPPAAGGGGPAA